LGSDNGTGEVCQAMNVKVLRQAGIMAQ